MFICLIVLVIVCGKSESESNFGCGKSSGNIRQTEGIYQSSVGEAPWHVGIFYYTKDKKYENICSGSIISPNVVITAASCVYEQRKKAVNSPAKYKVTGGKVAFAWEEADNNAQEIKVKDIRVLPNYQGEVMAYSRNLALLSLVKNFEFNEYIQPVCLDWAIANQTNLPEKKILRAFGWGFSTDVKHYRTLQQAALPYVSLSSCKTKFSSVKYNRFISSDKFCLTLPEGRQEFDSGSGVIIDNKGVNYIYGVLSMKIANEFTVATKMSKHQQWIKEEIIKIDKADRCSTSEFTCHNNECVRETVKCDGSEDCEDGSDELEMHCMRPPTNHDSNKYCVLPEQKGGVSYEIEKCSEGQCYLKALSHVYDRAIIKTHCGKGYAIAQESLATVVCIDGKLFPNAPNCIKLCPRLTKANVITSCSILGQRKPCEEYSRPDTVLHYACAEFYKVRDSSYYSGTTKCDSNGLWRGGLPNCVPECGIANSLSSATTVISFGNDAKYGMYPWHVGIFLKNPKDGSYKNVCGGSIINQHFILTAAHCTHERVTERKFDKNLMTVAAGKYKRAWDDHEDLQQTRQVNDILVKSSYRGLASSFLHDIALLKLAQPFDLNSHVLPVCLQNQLEKKVQIVNGIIVGWGRNEKKEASEFLQEIQLPVIPNGRCLSEFPTYQSIITYDKFCCYFVNGSGPGLGDSGGGMVNMRGGTYFVEGVISVKPTDNSIAILTNVSEHRPWIDDIINGT